MALDRASGSFLTPTVTGNFAVTGVGFQGKVLLLFGGRLADGLGSHTNLQAFAGAATSATNRVACGACANDGQTTSQAGRTQLLDRVYRETQPITTGIISLDFVSWDADGFTLDASTVSATPSRIFYVVLGGSEVTNARVGTFDTGTVTGPLAVTGVGFQPDLLFLMSSQHTRTSATLEGNVASAAFSFGVARSPVERWAFGLGIGSGTINPQTADFGVFRSDAALIQCDPLTSANQGEYDLDSFDADGFTIDRVVNAATRGLLYVALKGLYQAKLGTFTQPAVTGPQAHTGVGFLPSALLFGSASKVVDSAITDKGQAVLGVALGTTNRRVVAASSNSTKPSQCDTTGAEDACLIHMTAGTPTIDAQADLESFDADGFTFDWPTADAVARETGYLAMASAEGGIVEADGVAAGSATLAAVSSVIVNAAAAAVGLATALARSAVIVFGVGTATGTTSGGGQGQNAAGATTVAADGVSAGVATVSADGEDAAIALLTFTESFDQPDSTVLGPDLTWTEVVGDMVTDTNRVGNAVQ